MVTINETQSRILQSADRLRSSATSSSGEQLGKSDFMNLFMYQLSNQNPLEPMDSSKMMASLSQLGSMEQLQALNAQISELAKNQRDLVQFSALSFINRTIKVKDNSFDFSLNQNPKFNYELQGAAVNVKANIYNENNQVIRQLDLGANSAGNFSITWDGRDNIGHIAPAGKYNLEVYAYDAKGQSVAADVIKQAVVSQIKMEDGQPMLKVGDKFIHISEAVSID